MMRVEEFSTYTIDHRGEEVPLFVDASLEIPGPGVYSLEGPNQSGKTIFIKSLMQVEPKWFSRSGKSAYHRLKLRENGGNPFYLSNIKSIKDAYAEGLIAVFQDDELIPTMNLRQQILLRHCLPDFGSIQSLVVTGLLRVLGTNKFKAFFEMINWRSGEARITKLQDKFQKYYKQNKVLDHAEEILKSYGEEYRNLLNMYPPQMSGGAKAVSKLLCAQLYENSRILFLDESFNAVQADKWPMILSAIRSWAIENNKVLVVVTHNKNEIIRWQPTKRFEIRNCKIYERKPMNYNMLVAGIPQRVDNFPIYTPPYSEFSWLDSFSEETVVLLLDRNLRDHKGVKSLKKYLDEMNKSVATIELDSDECLKDLSHYEKVLSQLAIISPRAERLYMAIGGGTVLNFCSFLCSTVHRGISPFIAVPTTVLAIADVAVGSKSALNVRANEDKFFRKHFIGTYYNPSAVIVDPIFMETLSEPQLLSGLSECLKHGLLQDEKLFEDVLALIGTRSLDYAKAFQVAMRTMELKSEVLNKDPYEDGIGRILLYGHLHAHTLERVSEFKIPHSIAVYWGILIDLLLLGKEELYRRILDVIKNTGWLKECPNTIASCGDALSDAYWTDTKAIHFSKVSQEVSIFGFEEVGCYSNLDMPVKSIQCTLSKVLSVISRVNTDLLE